jgi:hypothetical protein
VVGLEDGLVVVLDRLVVLLLGKPGVAADDKGEYVLGVEADSLVVVIALSLSCLASQASPRLKKA